MSARWHDDNPPSPLWLRILTVLIWIVAIIAWTAVPTP